MKTNKITALIVDDDAKSREVLEFHLRTIPDVEIIGSASGADEAFKMLLQRVPDILFLDVEMPVKSGFDLLTDLRKLSISPCIIFQTAFDKYMIEAIRFAAFDYLLKPIDREELQAALARHKSQVRQRNLDERIADLCRFLDRHKRIRFNTRRGFIMIDPDEVIYLKADWSYTEIRLSKEKSETVSMNIGKVEELLPHDLFVRISRSVIINRNYIEKLDRKARLITLRKKDEMFEFKVTGSMVGKV